jgi:uncharacterized protein YpiB (UPF0302 family)
MENTTKHEADFVFIQGGSNVYFIEKDRYNWLDIFVAVDGFTLQSFIDSEYKTTVLNTRGEVIMQNFKNVDMKVVQELLSGVEKSYEERLQLLADIDKALDEGDKEKFMRLTELLNGGIENERGIA